MDFTLNSSERLNLKRMVNESECENNTENIRKLKHSVLIRNDIRKLNTLKAQHAELRQSNMDEFFVLCKTECAFLYEKYMDIFKKVLHDELDLEIMTKLLMVLKMIEDGKLDQHEGSVVVGRILKELYVDSAVKHADNLAVKYAMEKNAEQVSSEPAGEIKTISWREYKNMAKGQ